VGGNGNGPTRTDLVMYALQMEIERRRTIIDSDPTLNRIVITLHLSAGFGHPRSIECNLGCEKRILESENAGAPKIGW
jgi:hypothetical protein